MTINRSLLEKNARLAERNRGFFRAKKLLVLNVVSSPGSGKTTFIRETAVRLGARLRVGVIVGDLATDNDAARLRTAGIPVVQITTGTVCHLEAEMVAQAMAKMNLDDLDLLIVENVGNLVCPAEFALGTHKSILVASIPEGDDKPYKYPGMYRGVDAVVINKIDLLPYVPFRLDFFKKGIEALNPGVTQFELSCRTGEGLEPWLNWLLAQA